MLGLRKPNFKTKIIPFEKSHSAENCERGRALRDFLASILLQNFKQLKGTLWLESSKIFEKQKMRNFNSLIVPKTPKKGPFGIFLHSLLQNIKQIEGRTLRGH